MAKTPFPKGAKEGSPKEEAFDRKQMMAGKGNVGKKAAPSPTMPSKKFGKK